MKRDPLFRFRDFAIWTAILGGVAGYQLWSHATQPAITTVIATVGQMAG